MASNCLTETPKGIILRLKIQPRAAKNEISGLQDNALKVRLTAPPVDGAANTACCAFFAQLLNLPKGSISIASGEKSRHKNLLIQTTDTTAVRKLLAPWLDPGKP